MVPRATHSAEFFVVGGPVQPDRPCYIERRADQELRQAIADQRFCYVLGPRAIGKSSLMARTIRALRGDGQLAAVVDLNQIGARGESTEAGRWYYSIAYRIVRELRLKVDLQSWWQEKSTLMSEQRLAEFFWEIVLTNTTAAVTVFIDEIERAAEVPFSSELFTAIRACYIGRATEPDYGRLNFVVLGTATPAELCPDASTSPFEMGRSIELEDFTLEETYGLAPGFGSAKEDAQPVLERIYSWTAGHPYLTQKVARGVVRRGGSIDDVDRTVKDQFLKPGATQEEPLLNHMRSLLTQRSRETRPALVLISKLARGEEVASDPTSRPQELLRLSGLVSMQPDGPIRFRNRIFQSIFTSGWVRSTLPFNWRRLGTFAAITVAVIAIPLWYAFYVPRPYVRTLSVVTQDFAVAEDAYQKLRRLPGFGGMADRLMSEAMVRRSRQAAAYADVAAADARLRALPGGDETADALLAEYWLKRALQAAGGERRDEALLLAARALQGGNDAARGMVSELIGHDYARLLRTVRLSAPPADWEVDWQSQVVTIVDRAHRGMRLPFDPQAASRAVLPDRLTALQHVPLVRELNVDDAGSAGVFSLELNIDHAAAEELVVTLEAPSGTRATLMLPERQRESPPYLYRASGRSPLAALADEERQGIWRLTLADSRPTAIGSLLQLGLLFDDDEQFRRDSPEQAISNPDPVRTEQVEIELSDDGRVAVARPARQGAVGAIAVWDLAAGRLAADLRVPGPVRFLHLAELGQRLLVVSGDVLTLWDLSTGDLVSRLVTQTEFMLQPAIAVTDDYAVIAERLESGGVLYSLLRAEDGELMASISGMEGVRGWVLGPRARYLALLGPSRVVRVLDPRTGEVIDELGHERDVIRLVPVERADDVMLTVDAAGDIREWPIGADAHGPSRHLGTTANADSLSVAVDASAVAYESLQGHVVMRALGQEPLELHTDGLSLALRTRLAPDGGTLLTVNGAQLQFWDLRDLPAQPHGQADESVLALDRGGQYAALGSMNGEVHVRSVAALSGPKDGADARVEFIGHRGAVTSLALDAHHGLVVSGGADGVVRVWEMAGEAPRPVLMRHPAGPVHHVAISPNGQWAASAAEYSARIWRIDNGQLVAEAPINGTALVVGFTRDSSLVAVGDSAGNVFFASPTNDTVPRSLRAQAAVGAVAFAPGGAFLVSGDEAGYVQPWNVANGERVGEPQRFRHPIQWLEFSGDGEFLLVQSSHWLHRLQMRDGSLTLLESHLLPLGVAPGGAFRAADGARVNLIATDDDGEPTLYALDMTRPAAAVLPAGAPLLQRDWSAVLGLTVDPAGRVVPLQP